MARETKVGLLAGLAFIVCFAVILANRGQLDSRIRNHTFLTKTDKPVDARKHLTRKSVRHSMPGTPRERQAYRTNPSLRRNQPPPMRVDGPPPVSYSQPGANQSHPVGPRGGAQQLPDRVISTASRLDTMAALTPAHRGIEENSALTSTASIQAGGSASRLSRQMSHAGSVEELIRHANGAIVHVSTPRPQHFTPRVKKYKVKKGDTLYKVAATAMGKSSRRYVNAIFDANRSVLSSPDELKVGMNLIIPTISTQKTTSQISSTSYQQGKPAALTHAASPIGMSPSFRWYQIKKEDRYINIARNELGDAKRWPEIHQLNKKNFPNPDKIRAGVRIKLPLLSSVASTEPGR